MIMAWHRNWKMSLDLFSWEVIITMVSSVKSASPVANLKYPRTEQTVSFFSIAGSFPRQGSHRYFIAFFLVSTLSFINIIFMSINLHLHLQNPGL